MGSAKSGHIACSGTSGHVIVSVPARTEVAGNHQDHQGGCVIAAAIDRRIRCVAERCEEHEGREECEGRERRCIYVDSDDGERFVLDLDEPSFAEPRSSEAATAKAIVRGMAAKLAARGYRLSGCKLSFTSDIPIGMGLSSSAAFELCAGAAIAAISGGAQGATAGLPGAGALSGGLEPMELAQMAMQVEQDYFGKPCGLMDQAACALGGVVYMDFARPGSPAITVLDMPAQWGGYDYLLVGAGAGHEGLTADYASVAEDMGEVAALLGARQLRDLSYSDYLCRISFVREKLGDAAALRALGFFVELSLVERRLAALRAGDMQGFVEATARSSVCSAEYLQNVAMPGRCEPAMVALALCRNALGDARRVCGGAAGSARIHGGGFGGTIQVILPRVQSAHFQAHIQEMLSPDCCMRVRLGVPGIEVCEGV